jgi:hypothetical protein
MNKAVLKICAFVGYFYNRLCIFIIPGGIGARNTSKEAVSNLRLRLRSHSYQHSYNVRLNFFFGSGKKIPSEFKFKKSSHPYRRCHN